MTLCLDLVLEGVPNNSYDARIYTLSIVDSNICLDGLEEFPLHTYFKALNPRLVGEPYK
jgi:hypothetical protein